MHFKDFLKDYLTFNKRERRGILLLMAMIVTVILYLITAPYFTHNGKTDFSEAEKQIALMESRKQKSIDSVNHTPASYENKKTPVLLPFDPNSASRDEWVNMGVKERVANTIISYRNKGGKFRIKEDLKKIYGMDEKTYARIGPYVHIKNETRNAPTADVLSASAYGNKTKTEVYELNLSDSADLLKIRGIGPYYAGKIIRYREQLGGFADTRQLFEIYNFRDSTYMKIKDVIRADSTLIRKLNINTASLEELATHPYIRKNRARVIVNYRQQHGLFSSINDLKNIKIISPEEIEKLKPYLILK